MRRRARKQRARCRQALPPLGLEEARRNSGEQASCRASTMTETLSSPAEWTPTLSEVRENDDEDPVSRACAGDREAFRRLVEDYYPAVLGLCRRLLGGRIAEAEDLTQETFLNAYRYLPSLEHPARFASWLFQIARSVCRERRRRWSVEERALAKRVEMLRRSRPWAGADSSGGGEASAALGELPPEEREVLTLRYFDGLSYEEIAARLSLSFSQVDHRIRNARARLARRLAVRQRSESRCGWKPRKAQETRGDLEALQRWGARLESSARDGIARS